MPRLQSAAFGMTMLASACLNNVFVSYYFEMFTEIARVSTTWFFLGQAVFCVWNCGNDVLFGWMSDKAQCRCRRCCWINDGGGGGWIGGGGGRAHRSRSSSPVAHGLARRLRAIEVGGPIWVVAFVCVFWWPFDARAASAMLTGLYCMFALCFYDGMLTFVEINHSALLADMTTSSAERARANMYSSICAAIGSTSSFFAHTFWAPEDLAPFRTFCCVLGLVACTGFWFTVRFIDLASIKRQTAAMRDGIVKPAVVTPTTRASSVLNKKNAVTATATATTIITTNNNTNNTNHNHNNNANNRTSSPDVGFKAFLSQLSSQRNFKIFCLFYIMQVFDCTFEKNFLAVFIQRFAGTTLSRQSQSSVVSASFVLPWVSTIFVTPVVERFGVYNTVKRILQVRAVISVIGVGGALVFHQTSWLYLLINRVSSECVCRLIPLIISNLTDEDVHLNKRTSSLSASVIGTSGLIGKIGQSIAPVLGYVLFKGSQACDPVAAAATNGDLGRQGAELTVDGNDLGAGVQQWVDTGVDRNNLNYDCTGMYHEFFAPMLIALVPLVVVAGQIVLWRMFTLHGRYLAKVKASRNLSLSAAAV